MSWWRTFWRPRFGERRKQPEIPTFVPEHRPVEVKFNRRRSDPPTAEERPAPPPTAELPPIDYQMLEDSWHDEDPYA